MMTEIFREVDNPGCGCVGRGACERYSPVPVEEWVSACAEFLSHFHIHNNDGTQGRPLRTGRGNDPPWPRCSAGADLCPEATFTLEVLQAAPAVSWMLEERIFEG